MSNIDDIWFNTINTNSPAQIEQQIGYFGRGILNLKDPNGDNALIFSIKNQKWESFLALAPEFNIEELIKAQKFLNKEIKKFNLYKPETFKDKIINFFSPTTTIDRNLKRYNFLNDCERIVKSHIKSRIKPIQITTHNQNKPNNNEHTI